MPDEKQYDDELVQLLARGELSDRQIAERLGLSASQVSRIAGGEKRPDLQPKILAAMRKTLKAAWKNGGHLDGLGTGRLDTDSGQPLPAGTAQTAFDRHLAVELIASGQLTLSKIAERLGVHKTTVSRIMAGRSHPELQPLIREAEKHYRDRARRIGIKWSAQIVMKQIQVGLKDNGWVGLRARQDLLDRFLGPEGDRLEDDVPPAERDFGPELRDLPEPLKTEVIRALGGPAADEEDVEYPPSPGGLQPASVHWNDPSDGSQKPGASSRYPIAAPPQAEDAAALQKNDVAQPPSAEQEQKNDVASRSRCPSGSGASAEQEQKNDVAGPPSAEQKETTPLEEGCSRNKKRRNRQRRQVDAFIR